MFTLLMYGLGFWMALAPYAGLTPTDHAWNNWIIGIVIVGASLVQVQQRRIGPTTFALMLGIWLVLSGFMPTLHRGIIRNANDLIVGVMMLCCGAATAKPVRSQIGHT